MYFWNCVSESFFDSLSRNEEHQAGVTTILTSVLLVDPVEPRDHLRH